jgi:hypothetical protein
LQARPADRRLLDLLNRAVQSTLKALPSFVERGCCERHLQALGDDIQKLPWGSHAALGKRLVDAIRQAQQRAKTDLRHCCEQIPQKYDLRDFRALTSGFAQNCPASANAARVLAPLVRNAVRMLDNTIGQLVRARNAACSGKPLGRPNLSDLTACWLKHRLGVCIDDPAAWIKGAFRQSQAEPTPVAEIIRRLVAPRNLLATNQITYRCEATCTTGFNAWVRSTTDDGQCIRTPDRVIHLCPPFWTAAQAPFREQTIIHEAVHLTHCAPHGNIRRATGIGWPECLAQFVLATNGKAIDPNQNLRCGFTSRCGAVSAGCRRAMSNAATRSRVTPGRRPPGDWRPQE